MKKLLLVGIAVIAFAGSSIAIEVLAGGAVPLYNNVMGIGTMTLDFSSPSTDNQLGYLIVNNNSQQFDLEIDADNAGNFICTKLVPVIGAALATVPMVDVSVGDILEGTLGDVQGLGAPAPLVHGALNTGDMTGAFPFTWTYLQETATTNYGLGIFASWVAFDGLAGLYTENFVVSITATL